MPQPYSDDNPPPWWKQFWPWFLISIPAGTVVAAMFTINIAVKTDDGLVSKDYYKDGLAIHMVADAVKLARDLGIQADLEFQRQDNLLRVQVSSRDQVALGRLSLAMRHPTRADRDALLELQPTGPSTFEAQLPVLESEDWNLELTAIDSGWQLRGRANLRSGATVALQ